MSELLFLPGPRVPISLFLTGRNQVVPYSDWTFLCGRGVVNLRFLLWLLFLSIRNTLSPEFLVVSFIVYGGGLLSDWSLYLRWIPYPLSVYNRLQKLFEEQN